MAAAKKGLDILVGLGKPKAGDGGEDDMGGEPGADDESTEDFDSAASELLAAIKSDDESAFAESLKACILSAK